MKMRSHVSLQDIHATSALPALRVALTMQEWHTSKLHFGHASVFLLSSQQIGQQMDAIVARQPIAFQLCLTMCCFAFLQKSIF